VQYKLSKGTLVKIYRQLTVGEMQWGRLEDGNWVALSYVSFDTQPDPGPEPDPKPEENSGDMDGSGGIDKDDAIYLLRHVVYPEQYPLNYGE